ncbi:hypothetical protein QAD02_005739 [Eretmocerus hayati]|uniref:Uncharacterized protein n=1 Tax=Eretmocerus hayati TaxID=131215 RepID=A0ACC2NTT0_9HYME|nr:hypothetical protein QAD02_005739 [Eretmocerus hayati]
MSDSRSGQKQQALHEIDPNKIGEKIQRFARMSNYSFEIHNGAAAKQTPKPIENPATGLAEAFSEEITSAMADVLKYVDDEILDLKECIKGKLMDILSEEAKICLDGCSVLFEAELAKIKKELKKMAANIVGTVEKCVDDVSSIQKKEVQALMEGAASRAVSDWYGTPTVDEAMPCKSGVLQFQPEVSSQYQLKSHPDNEDDAK